MEKIELLAPAGDLERLKIAYLYGADACYIGGKEYSLRANASNFDIKEIKEACEIAHSLGKKLYVAVNILFHNEDLKGIKKYLQELNDIKVDALIVADPFIIPLIKKSYKNLEVFLSTQESTTNSESIKFYEKLGVSRVVLARETTKEEIKEIRKKTDVHLEVFLHGAMCTCLSGRCLLSNYFTNRDSNRGGCAQICRFEFDLDKKRSIPFSIATKDLNMAYHIKDLIEVGVGSLKIEGRMRSSYYIATVISSYRKLIDAYYNNTYTKELVEKQVKILSRVANRPSSNQFFKGYTNHKDQYYLGRMEISNQDFLAKVISYDKKTKMATIEQRNYFKKGDKVNIFGPNNLDIDYTIEEIYNTDGDLVTIANHPKEILKIKIEEKIGTDSFIRIKF